MATMHTAQQPWRSWKLGRAILTLTIFTEMAVFVGVIVTTVLTHTHNGFVDVSTLPITIYSNVLVSRRLLWSAIPAVVISVLNLVYAAIISSAAQRQPFVELMADGSKTAHSAKTTVMLDYASYPLLYVFAIAARNGHHHLGWPLFIQLLTSVSLVPLTSNLFSAATTRFPSETQLLAEKSLVIPSSEYFPDILPAMELSSAIWRYGARAPVWMTLDASVEPFSPQRSINGEVNVTTLAYTVKPQCEIIPPSQLRQINGSTSATNSTRVTFNDRGCDVNGLDEWTLPTSKTAYAHTWHQRCSDDVQLIDRIGIVIQTRDVFRPRLFNNLTVISCFPTYWNMSANLTISVNGTSATQIQRLEKVNETQMIDRYFRRLHAYIPLVRTNTLTGTLEGDTLGRTIYTYAQTLDSATPVSQEAMLEATQVIYSTFFAALSTGELTQDANVPQILNAQLTSEKIKLFASTPIAITTAVLLLSMIISTISVFVYTERYPSCLREEPKGLLRWAMILSGSDLMKLADKFKALHPTVQAPGEYIEDHYSVERSKCWYGDRPDLVSKVVCIENLAEMPHVPTRWRRFKNWIGLRLHKKKRRDEAVEFGSVEHLPLQPKTSTVNSAETVDPEGVSSTYIRRDSSA